MKEEPSIQGAYFTQSVDPTLLQAIKEGTDIDTPIYGEGSLMAWLEEEFEVLYPLFIHHMNLIQLKQDGEDPRSYLQCINQVSLEANFDMLNRQSFCVLHLAKMVEDNHLWDKIFQLGKPTYGEALKLVMSYLSNQRLAKAAAKCEVEQIATFKLSTNQVSGQTQMKTTQQCNNKCMCCGKT